MIVIAGVLGDKYRFDNYSLYKVITKNEHQRKLVQEIGKSEDKFDFWTDPSPLSDSVLILANPENKAYLENYLGENKVDFEITIPDIQR